MVLPLNTSLLESHTDLMELSRRSELSSKSTLRLSTKSQLLLLLTEQSFPQDPSTTHPKWDQDPEPSPLSTLRSSVTLSSHQTLLPNPSEFPLTARNTRRFNLTHWTKTPWITNLTPLCTATTSSPPTRSLLDSQSQTNSNRRSSPKERRTLHEHQTLFDRDIQIIDVNCWHVN